MIRVPVKTPIGIRVVMTASENAKYKILPKVIPTTKYSGNRIPMGYRTSWDIGLKCKIQ